MASFTFPIPSANYDGGKPAIGRNVRDDLDAMRTWVIGKNLDQDNIATLTDELTWAIDTNVQAINIQSTAEGITEFALRRKGDLISGGDPVEVARPSFQISYGDNAGDESDNAFDVSPQGNKLAPTLTTVERDTVTFPREREVVYNSDTDRYEYYDGSGWKALGSSDAVLEEDGTFRTNSSNIAQSWISVSTVTLNIVKGTAILLAAKGQTDSGFASSTETFPSTTGTNIRARIRWTADINGGGPVTIWESELLVAFPSMDPFNQDHYIKVPLGVCTTVDDNNGAGYSVGSSVVFSLEVNSLTNSISSLIGVKAQAVDI